MKLGKEEIQKIILGALLMLGLVYSYFDLLLGPLLAQQELTEKSIHGLGPVIQADKAEIAKVRELDQNAPVAEKTVRQINAMIPNGSPVAWFPTRTAEFFKHQGIDRVTTRLNSEPADSRYPGYRKLTWGIDLPKVGLFQFGSAIAAYENEEPLVEIASVQIDASREDVETQHAILTVNNLVRQ